MVTLLPRLRLVTAVVDEGLVLPVIFFSKLLRTLGFGLGVLFVKAPAFLSVFSAPSLLLRDVSCALDFGIRLVFLDVFFDTVWPRPPCLLAAKESTPNGVVPDRAERENAPFRFAVSVSRFSRSTVDIMLEARCFISSRNLQNKCQLSIKSKLQEFKIICLHFEWDYYNMYKKRPTQNSRPSMENNENFECVCRRY